MSDKLSAEQQLSSLDGIVFAPKYRTKVDGNIAQKRLKIKNSNFPSVLVYQVDAHWGKAWSFQVYVVFTQGPQPPTSD